MKNYKICLENKKSKIYSIISWLIIGLNFLAFLYLGFAKITGQIKYPLWGASLLAVALIFSFIKKDKEESKYNKFIVLFIIIFLTWLIMDFYLTAAINLVLFFFQNITRRKLEILIADDSITYPSFPKKEIQWDELSNIILKDGLLTIDFKSNKIIQQLIEKTEQTINEKEFNDFCKSRLTSG